MFWGVFDGFLELFGYRRTGALKRRSEEDDDAGPVNPKIRRIGDLNSSGPQKFMAHSKSNNTSDRLNSVSNAVILSNWEHDGKENIQCVKHNHVSVRNTNPQRKENMADSCGSDEVQCVGGVTFHRSLRDSTQNSKKAGMKCISDSELNAHSPQISVDDEIQIIHEGPKPNDFNPIQEVRRKSSAHQYHRTSSIFNGSSFKGVESSRELMFMKTSSYDRRKSVFPHRSDHNVQSVLKPSNRMSNGMGSSIKPQDSLLSLDSLSSRSRSTLYHERKAEDIAKSNELMRQAATLKSTRACGLSLISSLNGSKSKNDELQCFDEDNVALKLQSKCGFGRRNMFSRHEKLHVPVHTSNEVQPSTSAVRHANDDSRSLKERNVSRKDSASSYVDVMTWLNSRLQMYTEREKLLQSLAAEKRSESKQLAEVNNAAHLEYLKKREKEIADALKKHLTITEEIEDEIQEITPLPVLTPEMQREIDAALNSPDNKPLVDAFSITIKGRDIHTLRPLAWLNDEVINFYMNLLIERGKNDNYPSVYAFNTFFYPKLLSTGFSSLKRWTKKVDIFTHDFVVVPVHLGKHWCVAIMEMKKMELRYYDSFADDNLLCLKTLLKYLQDEHMDKKHSQYDISGWSRECVKDLPRQMNLSDCGMFSCMFSEYLTRRAPLTFSQENMPYFRRKMVYEILHKKLLC